MSDFNDVPEIQKDNINPKGMREVVDYRAFLNPDRRNVVIPELGFDIDTFENLCADFNPEDEILQGLSVDRVTMDKVCKKVYGMPFHETWLKLSGISKMLMRKVYNNLARSGNASAMSIQQSFLDLSANGNSNQPVQIVLDINNLNKGGKDDN